MEWDFTSSQVSLGKIDYKLEDFLRDFREEIDTNFPKHNDQEKKHICGLFYGVMYHKFNGYDDENISKIFKIDPEFVKIIAKENKANIDMLSAIIMNIFLRNMQETGGLLSDEENLKLVNTEVRRFHELHKL